MKNTKKNILKAVVLAVLCCPSVFAEGDMGSGGKTCPPGQPTCLTGDMGSGGLTNRSETESYLDSVLESVYWYFEWTR